MEILDLKTSVEVKNLLQVAKYDSFGFLFQLNNESYYSCSCGFSSKIKKRYDENIFEKGKTCPNCGCDNLIDVNDIMEDSICMGFTHKIIQDDEEFLVVGIEPFGFSIEEGNLCFVHEEYSEYSEYALLYDKRDNTFSSVEFCEGYNDKMVGTRDGKSWITDTLPEKTVAKMCNWEELMGYDLNSSSFFIGKYKNSGMDDIVNLFSKYFDTDIDEDEKDTDAETIITDLFKWSNFKYLRDAETKGIRCFSLNRRCYKSLIDDFINYQDIGIDVQKTTLEEATGLPISILKYCESTGDIVILKNWYNLLRENNLVDYVTHNLRVELNVYKINEILVLYSRVKDRVSLEKLLKHIIRATQQGFNINDILITDMHILDDCPEVIDFSKPFSKQLKKKYTVISQKFLSKEQYEQLQKKPTLDTLFKIL